MDSMNVTILAVAVAVALTGIAILLESGATVAKSRSPSPAARPRPSAPVAESMAAAGRGAADTVVPADRLAEHLAHRLAEAEAALRQQDRFVLVGQWSNYLLISGQYVVGGTLATSFVQQSLSSSIVGLLGVVVLVATIVHQRYRPDLKYRIASKKAQFLRSLIRRVEDRLEVEQDAPPYAELIAEVSRGLDLVETDDAWVDARTGEPTGEAPGGEEPAGPA